MDINFYNVDLEYIEFLKKYEMEHRGFTRVPNVNYHSGNNKFFYGAVLNVNDINYFVPVSSKTTPKQDDIIIKVKDKKNSNYGTLRFAYMLPIPKECLHLLIRDKLDSQVQSERIRKELAFCSLHWRTSGTVKCSAFYFAIKRQILQYFAKFIKIHT